MLKGFGNFLIKEIKELVRDPKILLGMIVVPLVMFPVLGGVMSYAVESAQEKAAQATLVVVDNDGGDWAQNFTASLQLYGVQVSLESHVELDKENVSRLLSEHNATQILEIPRGFSEAVDAHFSNSSVKAYVNFYGVLLGTSVFESVGSSLIEGLVSLYNRRMAPDVLGITKLTIIKGEVYNVDPAVVSSLMMSQSIAMPITIMILLTYAIQIAATSVAVEKEAKTLETLLTLPMDRLAILLGKLSGSILVAAIGAVAYMLGYSYLLGSIMSQIPVGANLDLAALGLVPSFYGYLLLGVSLFVTMFSALALAVIMSAFAEDVRSAQSFVGYIYPLIFLPSFALMYLDITTLPYALRLVFYAIPFSHPIIASKAIIMGDYWTAVLGVIYVSAFTIIVMYAASRLFATEKILTAKLKFKTLKTRGGEKPARELQ
ncbi:ABC transporter permease [Candidatus Bathyarchaeota archaeon]|nr:ABC transporter permease [Candidatus Bathyarchaeota archaeon]